VCARARVSELSIRRRTRATDGQYDGRLVPACTCGRVVTATVPGTRPTATVVVVAATTRVTDGGDAWGVNSERASTPPPRWAWTAARPPPLGTGKLDGPLDGVARTACARAFPVPHVPAPGRCAVVNAITNAPCSCVFKVLTYTRGNDDIIT